MLPKLITIGDFFLPSYGVMVSLAFLTGLWLAARLASREGLNPDLVVNLGIYCALAGVLGGKLLMLGFDWNYYLRNPGEIFSLTTLRAGGVFYGGLLLALGVAFYYMRRVKLAALKTADVLSAPVALGHAMGKIGCFLAGCCWGVECHRPWAVTFTNPDANRMFGTPLGIPLHPAQLYQSFAEAAIFVVLYRRFRTPHAAGSILGLYLALTAAERFLIEFARVHEQPPPFGGPLSTAQWISVVLAGAGMWLLRRRAR